MASRSMTGVLVSVALALLVHHMVGNIKSFLGFGVEHTLEYTDQNCRLLLPSTMHGSEDFAQAPGGKANAGLVLVSSGDLFDAFNHGVDTEDTSPGGVFAVDLRSAAESDEPRAVPIHGFPEGVRFQPHGINVRGDKLYAVNHAYRMGGTRVEIFRILLHPPAGDDGASAARGVVGLEYLRSVAGQSLFPLGALNDVVEGAYFGEFYVTAFKRYGAPVGGSQRFAESGDPAAWNKHWEDLNMLPGFIVAGITGAPTSEAPSWTKSTPVIRCTFDPEADDRTVADCGVAAEGFWGANGITANADRSLLYVSDPAAKAIVVLRRDPESGSLTRVGLVKPKHSCDNIEYNAESNSLLAGTMPALHLCLECGDRTREERPCRGKSNPGGALRITLSENGLNAVGQTELVLHDGSKLSQIASAFADDASGRILLGSPYSDGVLLCERPAAGG